jgi:lipopolysaccharide export LptBFGC system permease protein LptF
MKSEETGSKRQTQNTRSSYWDAFDALQSQRVMLLALVSTLCAIASATAFYCLRHRPGLSVFRVLDLVVFAVYVYLTIVTFIPVVTGGAMPGVF